MNGDLLKKWKKVVMICFKVLIWQLLGKSDENHENVIQNNQPRKFEYRISKYEAGIFRIPVNEGSNHLIKETDV